MTLLTLTSNCRKTYKVLYIFCFYLFLQKRLPDFFEPLTFDKTSKNDGLTSILTYFYQKSGRGVLCRTPPPSGRFYCIYRPSERGRSPAGLWSSVRAEPVKNSNQFPAAGRIECGGRQVLSWARSLTLSKWTAGAHRSGEFSETGGLYSVVTHHTRYSLRRRSLAIGQKVRFTFASPGLQRRQGKPVQLELNEVQSIGPLMVFRFF